MCCGGKNCYLKPVLSSEKKEPSEGTVITPGPPLFFSEGLLFVLPK